MTPAEELLDAAERLTFIMRVRHICYDELTRTMRTPTAEDYLEAHMQILNWKPIHMTNELDELYLLINELHKDITKARTILKYLDDLDLDIRTEKLAAQRRTLIYLYYREHEKMFGPTKQGRFPDEEEWE